MIKSLVIIDAHAAHCRMTAVDEILLRGTITIVNRTYGTHKNLYIYLFLLTIFGPIYYAWSPVILDVVPALKRIQKHIV